MTSKRGAVLLAGGASSRMGTPKAWLEVAGEPLLVRVAKVLLAVVEPVIIVARPDQELPELVPGLRVVRDRIAERGPLEGIAAGLEALEGIADAAFVCATDLPLLRASFISRVFALLEEHDLVAPRVRGRLHPLAAVWRGRTRAAIEARVARGELRVMDAVHALDARVVDEALLLEDPSLLREDPELASVTNVNTPEDLARLSL